MKNVYSYFLTSFFVCLLLVPTSAISTVSLTEPLSSSTVRFVNGSETSSYDDKKDMILRSIYSEADYLLNAQNQNSTDRFAYGDFYLNWWSQDQWYDPEEARAQEPVYLLAWLYTNDQIHKDNQTILSAIIKAIDRYCRWQLDGSFGRIGLTYATTAFMSSVLRAYRLIRNVDLGKIIEFENALGDSDDINSRYELYLTPSYRWALGDGFRIATVDTDYFVLYPTAPAQNRRALSSPVSWLDRFSDNYSDFNFDMSVQFFDNFTGSVPLKIQNKPAGDWSVYPVVANITGSNSGRWQWLNFTITSDRLYINDHDTINFCIENRLTPFKIKRIIVQIDRRDFWRKTFENAGMYLSTYFSDRALNQEAGALYSLGILYNITGDNRYLQYYNEKMSRFQSYQIDGVFPEIDNVFFNDDWWASGYDGDYLQLTIYWLTMLHKEVPDESILTMLNGTLNFMAYLYFPEGQWEAGISTRSSSSSPFAEGMAPQFMVPYFAMSHQNGYAARIAEIYYKQICFNDLSTSPDWYRHMLNPVAWVDLYESLIPNPNEKGQLLPIESNEWYLKDFSKIKILVVKTPKYATFISYGNTTTANTLGDFYEIESGKHLLSSRGDTYSPWGFGVISLNSRYFNSYEIQSSLTILSNSSDPYVIRLVGHLKTSTFTAAPVYFNMTYSFYNESLSLSMVVDFEEDVYVDSLMSGATPVNLNHLDVLITCSGLLAQNLSLENGPTERIYEYNNVESVFLNDLSLTSNGSRLLTVLDMSNSKASPYGCVEYVGWNLVKSGKHFAPGDSIMFTNGLTFGSVDDVEKNYVDVDEIINRITYLRELVSLLTLSNTILAVLLISLALFKVYQILRRRHVQK